ncbi:MAG: tetratricopeptide repeat protein [Acidobacteriia bacterium]|nr:tetratricopeptide repeat protein [Terriglobia bacterium]
MKHKTPKGRKSRKKTVDSRPSWPIRYWPELLIVVAGLLCDFNSWGHKFVLDDTSYIVNNLSLQSPSHFLKLFVSPLVTEIGSTANGLYRPLTAFTFALNYQVTGLSPDGFHFINRILHIFVCLTVFWVLRRMFGSSSHVPHFTALLFAVHPIQSEAVTYLTGRSDTLAMLLMMWAWLTFLRARATQRKGAVMASVVFYFLAMLSKESAVPWISIALLTELVFLSDFSIWRADGQSVFRRLFLFLRQVSWPVYIGYVLALGSYLSLRFAALKNISGVPPQFIDNPLIHQSIVVRILTAMKVLFLSGSQIFWPAHFSADYSFNQIPLISRWTSPAGVTILLLMCGVMALLIWTALRALRVFFGIAYFLLTYSVVSNLFIIIGTIRADRVLYMPSLGILLIGALGIDRIEHQPSLVVAKHYVWTGFSVLLLLLGIRTAVRNADWRDAFSLASSTVRQSPNSAKAHEELGTAYFDRKDFVGALEEFRIGEKIFPESPQLMNDIGGTLLNQGKVAEAIPYLRRAADGLPNIPSIRYNLMVALTKQGDFQEAQKQYALILEYYDDLIRQQPDNPYHHFNKGNALFFGGRNQEAQQEFERTLQLDPSFTPAQKSVELIQRRMQGR